MQTQNLSAMFLIDVAICKTLWEELKKVFEILNLT